MRRRVVAVGAIAGVLFLVLNSLAAFMATRPALQARLFGSPDRRPQDPEDIGLPYERVTYASDRWGWWIPAESSKGVVVIVHGFGLSKEPIRFAPQPLVQFAGDLYARGFSTFLINLGYATGAHHY